MGKEKTLTSRSIFAEIFQFGVYKRSQGRITRQVTCVTIWIAFALAAWRLWVWMGPDPESYQFPMRIPVFLTVLLAGLWLGFRIVNMPRFADFLIAVEAEMNKVSWPSRAELFRSSLVVIMVIFLLAAVLFGFDLIWQQVFVALGVRPG
jgi:preprotein translocase subunit SecE